MSWDVKTTCFEAPWVWLGGSGVSIGGVRILRVKDNCQLQGDLQHGSSLTVVIFSDAIGSTTKPEKLGGCVLNYTVNMFNSAVLGPQFMGRWSNLASRFFLDELKAPTILLMEEILHQLVGSLSHYLQRFIHPRWCRISSISSISWDDCIFTLHEFRWFLR